MGGFLANAAAIITYQNKQYKYTNTFTKAIAIPFQPFYSGSNNDQHWKSLNWGFQENKSYVVNVQNDFAAIALVTAIDNNEICKNVHVLEIPRLPKSQIPGPRELGHQFYKANTHCLFNFFGYEHYKPMVETLTRNIVDTDGIVHDIRTATTTSITSSITTLKTEMFKNKPTFRGVKFIIPPIYCCNIHDELVGPEIPAQNPFRRLFTRNR